VASVTSLLRRRALLLSLSMAGAALGARAMRPHETVGAERAAFSLGSLIPGRIGPWLIDLTVDAFVRPADLQTQTQTPDLYDQVLERAYVREDGYGIMMSVAYGRQQSLAFQLHRPELCYKAWGYETTDPVAAPLTLESRSLPAMRMRAFKPGRPEPITYWTLLGDEVVADPGEFRRRQFMYGLRGRILDGLLFRLSSIDPRQERAWQLHAEFAALLDRQLAPEARRRVMGA
jgi:EpsI family protein